MSDEEYIMSCADEISKKISDCGGGPISRGDYQALTWTLAGIWCREGKESLDNFVKQFQYKPPKKPIRGYS